MRYLLVLASHPACCRWSQGPDPSPDFFAATTKTEPRSPSSPPPEWRPLAVALAPAQSLKAHI